MTQPTPVIIPLINPNENEALLAALHVRPGQQVVPGQVLATLETTKSTQDLTAETGGYVVGLNFSQGDTLRAGVVLCYLAESAGAVVPAAAPPGPDAVGAAGSVEPPPGLRITQPALALARQHGLDLSRLPSGPLVTEGMVRQHIARPVGTALDPLAAPFDPTALIIYGGGGHGKSLVDLLRALGVYHLVGVVDDGKPAGGEVLGVPLLGGGEVLVELYQRGVRLAVNAVGGIGNLAPRLMVFNRLAQAGFACPAVVHPSSWVEPSASLSAGVQVFPHAYVGSAARVGFGCIVNTGAILSHDVVLGDYTNISPGAILAGAVEVGERVLIGMGVTINLEVKVGAGSRIGNSATVKADVPAGSVVRAGTVWPKQKDEG
jgi:acetyltransferase EpsM